MPIICKDYTGPSDKMSHGTVDKFIHAYPKPNPNTPLGPDWKFAPCFLPKKSEKYMDQIENFEVRPDDVWSVTYPKTGSTWSQEMIWLLSNDLNYELAAQKTLFERFPFLEFDGLSEELNFNIIETLKETPSPRHIKSHLPAGLLPVQIWKVKPKIIYVARGTKDTAVSFYHHYVHLQQYKGTFQDFLEIFLDDKAIFSPYHPHVKDFWYMKKEDNILFLTYEEMKANLMAVLRKTAKFLGKNYSEEQLKQLEKHLSFDSMKTNQQVNMSHFKISFDFIRKGKVGSSKEEMSPEMREEFDKWTLNYNAHNGTSIRI